MNTHFVIFVVFRHSLGPSFSWCMVPVVCWCEGSSDMWGLRQLWGQHLWYKGMFEVAGHMVDLPLWKIWVRRLGLWHSQLNGKSSNSMVPKHQAAIVRVTSSQISQLVAFTSHSKIKKVLYHFGPHYLRHVLHQRWLQTCDTLPSLDWDLEVHVARRPPASTFHHC